MGPQGNLTDNPRCLQRDLSAVFANQYIGKNVTHLVMSQTTHGAFDKVLEARRDTLDGSTVHTAGHVGVGGFYGQVRGQRYHSLDRNR